MPNAPQQHKPRGCRPSARPHYWRWYSSAAWIRMSRARIAQDGACRRCGAVLDLVCDHIQEHNGDAVLFWRWENTQCLCRRCNTLKRHGK